jgi:serine/threonine protein kinase
MHKKNIVHRDIKPENIFVDSNMNLKVGDFGVSKLLENNDQSFKTQTGTPYYIAPEMYKDTKYTHKVDFWSLGCVLYELCALERPFVPKNNNMMMHFQQL